MDKEKLIFSDAKIMRKIEGRTLFDDKGPSITGWMALGALGLNLVVNGPHVIENIRNDLKPVGPYSVGGEPWYSMPMETIPAYGSDALQLSDNLDGLLSTSGYAVFIDTEKLLNELQPGEALIAKQEDVANNGDKVVSGSLFVASETPYYDGVMNDLIAAGVEVPEFTSAAGTAGGEHSLQQDPVDLGIVQINSGGTMLHAAEPSRIVVERYHVESDGTVTPISHDAVTAEFIDNTNCADMPEEVSTEAILTLPQYDVICQLLQQYSELIPDDYAIRLDAIDSTNSKNDSAHGFSRTIQLTYPYIGKTQVETDDLRRTALHEIFHTAYLDQIIKDPLYLMKMDEVYLAVRNSTDYRIPSDEELSKGLTPSLQDAEKVIGIITESNYIGPDSNSGHPWDNATEMLSSTVTVLANYPHEFIENYEQLNGTQKQAIRGDVRAVFDLIERYDADVSSIIPREDLLREALGL